MKGLAGVIAALGLLALGIGSTVRVFDVPVTETTPVTTTTSAYVPKIDWTEPRHTTTTLTVLRSGQVVTVPVSP